MRKKIKIAIIGFGNIGTKRLDSLIKIKNIDICYIVDKKKFLKNIIKFKNNYLIKKIKYLKNYKDLIHNKTRLVDAAIMLHPLQSLYDFVLFIKK